MSTSKEFITYIRECIADPRARLHPMFGEYALYYDEKVVALICDGTIFLKITPGTTKILEDTATGPAYPGSKDFYILPEEILENHNDLIDLIRTCAQDVPIKKKKIK